jgi:hypothetical protein
MRKKPFWGNIHPDHEEIRRYRTKAFLGLRDAFVAFTACIFAVLCGVISATGGFAASPEADVATPTPSATPTQVSEPTPAAGSEAILSSKWPSEVLQYDKIISDAMSSQDLDPELMAALIYRESWFPTTWAKGYERCPDGPCSSSCTSVAGALGPAQVMPYHFREGENGRDPKTNITRAAEILREDIDKMGSELGGLAAYQCGPSEGDWKKPDACWKYAASVLTALASHTQ